jgi:prepilin-type processing-associated H-X9-DG protein
MIADAWYRPRPGVAALQQEGTFHTAWSGEGLAYFPPHGSTKSGYEYTANRQAEAIAHRKSKGDGKTNTYFFDGHAEPVKSKSFFTGQFERFYGYPGTVNGAEPLPDGYWK